MGDILARVAGFIAIILLGFILRRVGFFHQEDFTFLSKLVLKITLPAAVVSSMAGRELEASLLAISLLGLVFGGVYIAAGFLFNLGRGKDRQAFEMLNLPGYNIGNFALPFLQSFLGPTGVTAAILLDTGNAFVCLGGAYSIAATVKDGKGGSLRRMLTLPFHSVPFVTYLIMTALCLLRVRLPAAVVSFAGLIGNANVFLSMLMIGVGFQLSADPRQLGAVVRMLLIRFGLAVALALVSYYLLPLEPAYRKALAVLVFAPISGAHPPFTAELGGDVGMCCCVNSLSILISIPCMIAALFLVQ